MHLVGFHGWAPGRRVVRMTPRALVLLAHPDPRSLNAKLATAYAHGWSASGGDARVVDLTRLDFDLVLRGGHSEAQALEPDLVDLRAAFEGAAHVAWFFPVYWGAPPAVVRAVVDRLFLPGWAFQYRGHALPDGLLRGRSSRVVATMDSPGWWYALMHRWSLHAVMGTATLRFCGFSPVDFTMVHTVRKLDAEARGAWIARVAELGRADAGGAARRARAVPALPPSKALPARLT